MSAATQPKTERGAQAPRGLTPRGRRIWRECIEYLREIDAWRPAYRELVERYVRSIDRADALRKEAGKNPTVKGSKGQPVANPAAKLAREAELDAHAYAKDLLLTPAALRRHFAEDDPSRGGNDDDLGF